MDLLAISAGGSLAENWAAVSGAVNPLLYFLGATAALRGGLGLKNFFDGGFDASLGKPIMMLYLSAMTVSLPSFINSTAERLASEHAEKLAMDAAAIEPANFEKFPGNAGAQDQARADPYKKERERREAYATGLNDVVGWTGVGWRLDPPEGKMGGQPYRTAKSGPYLHSEVKNSAAMAGAAAPLIPRSPPVVKEPEAKPSEAESHALLAANAAMKMKNGPGPEASPSKAGSEPRGKDSNPDRGDLAAVEPVDFEEFQKDKRQQEQERRDAYKKGFNDVVGWAGEGKPAGQPSAKMDSQNYKIADGRQSLRGDVKDSMAIASGKGAAHAPLSLGAKGPEPKQKSEAPNPAAVATSAAAKSERLATPEEARAAADQKALFEVFGGVGVALVAYGMVWIASKRRRSAAKREALPEVQFLDAGGNKGSIFAGDIFANPAAFDKPKNLSEFG